MFSYLSKTECRFQQVTGGRFYFLIIVSFTRLPVEWSSRVTSVNFIDRNLKASSVF
jgi:hypothetical protein